MQFAFDSIVFSLLVEEAVYLSAWWHVLFSVLMDGSLKALAISLEYIDWKVDCKIDEDKLAGES